MTTTTPPSSDATSSPERDAADSELVLAQVLMNTAQHARVLRMSRCLGIDPADLFNVALNVLEWAMREQAEGKVVAALDERNGTYVELELNNRPPTGATLN